MTDPDTTAEGREALVARNDYLTNDQARDLWGLDEDDDLPEGRIRVCDGEWVQIPGGYYFDKSAGPLHPRVTIFRIETLTADLARVEGERDEARQRIGKLMHAVEAGAQAEGLWHHRAQSAETRLRVIEKARDAAGYIGSIETCIADMDARAEAAEASLATAQAEIASLREAMAPLVRAAEALPTWCADDERHWPGEIQMPTGAELRRARALAHGETT